MEAFVMKRLTSLLFLAVGLISPANAADAQKRPAAKDVFAQLSTLVGAWEGTYAGGGTHQVRYRLTANGYALVETWTMSATRESITIYYLDGDRLLAEHFCPQGNAPRMRMTGGQNGRYRFTFTDGANLRVPGKSHQHSVQIGLLPDGTFERSEYYVENGKSVSASEEATQELVHYRRLPQ
jgi:hypothetical protein